VWAEARVLVVAGLCVEVALGLVDVGAARAVTRRRRPWPMQHTVAFLTGLIAMAVVLQSGFDGYADDVFWAHLTQHVVLMSVAPLLLALGAPVTLALQALRPAHARRLVGVLRSRPIRALCGRPATGHLFIEYYGLMFVYLLTPASGLAARSETFHVTVHAAFFLCGLLFWTPVIGADPIGWKPPRSLKLALVAAGVPMNAALALATSSWTVLVVTELTALLGLVVVLVRDRQVRTGLIERWCAVRAGRSVALLVR
jgi:cytochrome c oxidase assembly factor CtaG